MSKAKLEICILDIGKIEAIKDLINELLDTIDELNETGDDWDVNQGLKKRKQYIDRFANIITGYK